MRVTLPVSAYQQRAAHFGFQPLHLLGKCWLTDVQRFRRLTEMQMVREHEEGTQFR